MDATDDVALHFLGRPRATIQRAAGQARVGPGIRSTKYITNAAIEEYEDIGWVESIR